MISSVSEQEQPGQDVPIGNVKKFKNSYKIIRKYQRTVTPSIADNCLAFSDSNIHVFETNTTGTLS